jgi:hypothetical protein
METTGMNQWLLLFNSLIATFVTIYFSPKIYFRTDRWLFILCFALIVFYVNLLLSVFTGIEAIVRAISVTLFFVFAGYIYVKLTLYFDIRKNSEKKLKSPKQ